MIAIKSSPYSNTILLDEQSKGETPTRIITKTTQDTVVLPPTPTASDDEEDIRQKTIKLQRRGTVSLADLIPVASAALRARSTTSTQDSPLARALTKVKIGVQTHRLKERILRNEWIRLALATPVDEATVNNYMRISKTNRTKEIVLWYEYKFKRLTLTLEELEKKVDELRRQRLLLVQYQQSITNCTSLPSPPATHLFFSKIPYTTI
jgi:hypothetical protein